MVAVFVIRITILAQTDKAGYGYVSYRLGSS